jgi:hypothetical protein
MSHVKITNGSVDQYPYTISDLKSDNPNVSFPKDIDSTTMQRYKMYPVTTQDMPDFDAFTQKVDTATTPVLSGSDWVLTRTVVDMTVDEIAGSDDDYALTHRQTRDDLLSETDFHALSDVTLTTEMATYRQSLRDVTSQSGWPRTVAWPTKP